METLSKYGIAGLAKVWMRLWLVVSEGAAAPWVHAPQPPSGRSNARYLMHFGPVDATAHHCIRVVILCTVKLWGLEGVKGALSSADDTIRNYS